MPKTPAERLPKFKPSNLDRARSFVPVQPWDLMNPVCHDYDIEVMAASVNRYIKDTKKIVRSRLMKRNRQDRNYVRLMFSGAANLNPHEYKVEWLKKNRGFSHHGCLFFPCSRPGTPNRVNFNYKEMAVARAMLLLTQGLPPEPKMIATHKCGNGHLSCVNPRHLSWGTAKTNARDAKLHHSDDVMEIDEETREAVAASKDLVRVLAVDHGITSATVASIKAECAS